MAMAGGGRRWRIEKQLGAFVRQYGRRGRAPHDPNDRGYDRKIEQQLKRLRPEELDELLRDERAADLMDELQVVLETPKSGWLTVNIAGQGGAFTAVGSDVPFDFLAELVRAIASVIDMEGVFKAVLNEEPRELAFEFRRMTGTTILQVVECKTAERLFVFSGRLTVVVLPFWRALRRLESRWPAGDWRWAFPENEMAQLSVAVKALKAAG